MKKQRVTLQLVIEIPVKAKPEKLVCINGGESTVVNSISVVSTEDIGNVVLPSESRRAEAYTLQALLKEHLRKIGLSALNVNSSTNYSRENGKHRPDGVYLNISFGHDLHRKVSDITVHCADQECEHTICKKENSAYLDFIIKGGEVYYEDGEYNLKHVGPLGDPNLTAATNMINKRFAWIRTFMKDPSRYNLDRSYAALYAPKKKKKAKR